MNVLEEKYGIKKLFDSKYFCDEKPDKQIIFTYLTLAVTNLMKIKKEEKKENFSPNFPQNFGEKIPTKNLDQEKEVFVDVLPDKDDLDDNLLLFQKEKERLDQEEKEEEIKVLMDTQLLTENGKKNKKNKKNKI